MSIIADEAKAAGRTRHSLPVLARPNREERADCRHSVRMDKGLLVKPADGLAYLKERLEAPKLAPAQVRESELRNQIGWIAWTHRDDRFWDFAAFSRGCYFSANLSLDNEEALIGYVKRF